MTDYLLGCDVGTTSTKTVLLDKRVGVIGTSQANYDVLFPQSGWAEQNPDWYWDAVIQTTQDVLETTGIDPANVAGVGITGMAPNCILVDRKLNALKLAPIWMDNRSTDECARLRDVIGEETAWQTSANPIHPYYGLPKLLWEQKHNPQIYRQTYKVLNAKDYIVAQLTGLSITDYSTATLQGVAFDIRKKIWDTSILKEIDLDLEKLPEAYPCDTMVGQVSQAAAKATGLMAGTPIIAGTVDTGADATACGTIEAGHNFLTMGTAICLGFAHDQPNFSPGLMAFPHPVRSENNYITTGAVTSGGALIKWFADLLNVDNLNQKGADKLYQQLNRETETIPPGSNGLIALPYFMGERAPIWNPLARGVLFGLSLTHQRGHIMRALMESVGYALNFIMELARESNIQYSDEVTLIGGGAKSKTWRQIIADITGFKTIEAKNHLGAAVGAAIIAGVGMGALDGYSTASDWVEIGPPVLPNPKHSQIYEEAYPLFKELYRGLRPHYVKLHHIG